MKKLIPVLLILLSSLSYAESMQFVTVLSSPVGSFNKLEAVDSQTPAVGQTVNFCTQIGNSGMVELKGTSAAQLSRVVLSNNTTLGRRGEGKYSLNNINLQHGGTVIGGRLLGNTLSVTSNSGGKAGNVYGNTLTVSGAKTDDLTVTNESFIKKAEQDSALINNAPEMVWSNEYQQDDACKSGSSYENCKKQYLLKSKGEASSNEEEDPSDNKCLHCSAYEKGSAQYNNCVKNSVINIDTKCCGLAASFFPTEEAQKTTKCWRMYGCDRTYGGSRYGDTYENTAIGADSLKYYFPDLAWDIDQAEFTGNHSFTKNCLGLKGDSFFRKKESNYVEYIPWPPACSNSSNGCEQFINDGCAYYCQIDCYRSDKQYFCNLEFLKPFPQWGWVNY